MSHMDDAIREFAFNHGKDHPYTAWLLHDCDVWVRNPHYTGPPQPHPDSVPDDFDDTAWEDVKQPPPPEVVQPPGIVHIRQHGQPEVTVGFRTLAAARNAARLIYDHPNIAYAYARRKS